MLDLPGLMARLDKQIGKAKPVPLTDQVRLNKEEMYATLAEMRTMASTSGLTAALTPIGAMEEQIRHARPVPLTDEVRLPRASLEKMAGEIRARVSPTGN